ncbi:MAG: MFS transporter [Deinococcus sp.]|nr:MFS transporter [Deinococcus sp.]
MAPDLAPAQPRAHRFLYSLGLTSFLLIGALQAMYGPAFPYFQTRYQVPASQLGLMVSFHFLSAMVGTILAGASLHRLGYRRLLVAAAVLLATGSGGMAVSPAW